MRKERLIWVKIGLILRRASEKLTYIPRKARNANN